MTALQPGGFFAVYRCKITLSQIALEFLILIIVIHVNGGSDLLRDHSSSFRELLVQLDLQDHLEMVA